MSQQSFQPSTLSSPRSATYRPEIDLGAVQASGGPVRHIWYRDWMLLGTLLAALAIDQASKYLVRLGMEPGQAIPAEGPVRLHYITNTGSAFGFFQGQTLLLVLASVAGIALLAFFYRTHSHLPSYFRFGLGLLLGGAIGNLIDRLLWGGVTDFISVGWWPTFNLADSSIVVGMATLAVAFLFPQRPTELTTSPNGRVAEEPGDSLRR